MSEKHDRIKDAAESGWSRFIETEEAKGFAPIRPDAKKRGTAKTEAEETQIVPFKDLSAFEKSGLYAQVAAIIETPLAEPHASFMPNNHDRKACRALDDCLRDALGYARFDHQ